MHGIVLKAVIRSWLTLVTWQQCTLCNYCAGDKWGHANIHGYKQFCLLVPTRSFYWTSSRGSWLLCVSKTEARLLLCEVHSSGTANKKAHYWRNACAFDNGRTILIHTVVLFLSAGRIWEHDTVWQSRVSIWLVPLPLCWNGTGSRGELVLSWLHEAWLRLKLWMFMCICL